MVMQKTFRCLIDENVELRLLEEEHAEDLFALTLSNRQHLHRWLPWVDGVHSVCDTKRYIRSCLDQFTHDNGFQVGIWHRGKLAGVIGYHGIDWMNRSTAIGYWIGARFQGKGVVTRACRLLVDLAFREWRLNRVEIRCAIDNCRSRNVPRRLGFTEEGIARQAEWLYDRFVDLVVYGMLAEDWKRLNQSAVEVKR